MARFISKIKNGKLHPYVLNLMQQAIMENEGKDVEIIIKPKKRSLAQNRYRFGVIVKTVTEYLNAYLDAEGLPLANPEDVDLMIKDKALGLVHKVNTPLGEMTIVGRLRDKTPAQFEESMEAIRAYFAPKGILIPLPNENMIEEWYADEFGRNS